MGPNPIRSCSQEKEAFGNRDVPTGRMPCKNEGRDLGGYIYKARVLQMVSKPWRQAWKQILPQRPQKEPTLPTLLFCVCYPPPEDFFFIASRERKREEGGKGGGRNWKERDRETST